MLIKETFSHGARKAISGGGKAHRSSQPQGAVRPPRTIVGKGSRDAITLPFSLSPSGGVVGAAITGFKPSDVRVARGRGGSPPSMEGISSVAVAPHPIFTRGRKIVRSVQVRIISVAVTQTGDRLATTIRPIVICGTITVVSVSVSGIHREGQLPALLELTSRSPIRITRRPFRYVTVLLGRIRR